MARPCEVSDLDWIDDCVAVGNWYDGFSANVRRREGIDLIVDARLLFTKSFNPSRREPLVDNLVRARDQLVEISALKPKVLIFCNRGRDRSSFLAMLYLSKKTGIGHREAYEVVHSKRRPTAFHWDWVEAVENIRSP